MVCPNIEDHLPSLLSTAPLTLKSKSIFKILITNGAKSSAIILEISLLLVSGKLLTYSLIKRAC